MPQHLDQRYVKRLKILFGKDFVTEDGTIEPNFLAYFQRDTGIVAAHTAGIYAFHLADTTEGDANINLDAAILWSGKQVIVKADVLTDSNVVNVIPDGSETIDGQASFVINTLQGAVTLYSDGTNIHVISYI